MTGEGNQSTMASMMFALAPGEGGKGGACQWASPDACEMFDLHDGHTLDDVLLNDDWHVVFPAGANSAPLSLSSARRSEEGDSAVVAQLRRGSTVYMTAMGTGRRRGTWKITVAPMCCLGGVGGNRGQGINATTTMVVMNVVAHEGTSSMERKPSSARSLPPELHHSSQCSPLLLKCHEKSKSMYMNFGAMGPDVDEAWNMSSDSASSRAATPATRRKELVADKSTLDRCSSWDCISALGMLNDLDNADGKRPRRISLSGRRISLPGSSRSRFAASFHQSNCNSPFGVSSAPCSPAPALAPATPRSGMVRSRSHESLSSHVTEDEEETTLEPAPSFTRRLSSGQVSQRVTLSQSGDQNDSPWWTPLHQQLFLSVELMLVSDDREVHKFMEEGGSLGEIKFTACTSVAEAKMLCASRHFLPDIVVADADGWDFYESLQSTASQASEVAAIFLVPGDSQLSTVPDDGVADYIGMEDPPHIIRERILAQVNKKKVELMQRDVKASNSLLQNVFPSNIVDKLKKEEGRTASARGPGRQILSKHDSVTILFSDIVQFTDLSSRASTEDVVMMLDSLFMAFDTLCDVHGVTKVETIGDAYMVVAGQDGRPGHATRMAAMAEDMLEAARHIQQPLSDGHVHIRIGLHSGPVSSGVVGRKCPRFCYFGDTVNTASRMESNGVPMGVHLSNSTAELLRADAKPSKEVKLLSCGTQHIKGKGMMQTYVVASQREEARLLAAIKEKATKAVGVVSEEEIFKTVNGIDAESEEVEEEDLFCEKMAVDKGMLLLWGVEDSCSMHEVDSSSSQDEADGEFSAAALMCRGNDSSLPLSR